jgi:flap endonuclease-1
MGVNLSDIIQSQKCSLEDFADKTVAIDAYNVIYQFLTNIRTQDGSMLMDDQGRPTSHLTGLFSRTAKLVSLGIKPIFVFDGKPHELKTRTIQKRQAVKEKAKAEYQLALETGDFERARMKAAQSTHLTSEMVADTQRLLGYLGIPWLQAPSEGEAQACYLAQKGDAWAVVSQDFDALLFGASRLIRNLTVSGRRKVPGQNRYVNVEPEMIDVDFVLSALGLDRNQLIDMSILVGTDFNPGVKGYGPKKALKALREFKDLETVIKEKELEIPDYDLVQKIFREPPTTDDYNIQWSAVDSEKVYEFLCEERNFSTDRVKSTLVSFEKFKGAVAQKSLDQWF